MRSPASARRLHAICLASGLAGVVAVLLAYFGSARPYEHAALFLFFTVFLTASHFLPLRILHGEGGEDLHIDEALFVPMALLLSPVGVVAAFGIGVGLR